MTEQMLASSVFGVFISLAGYGLGVLAKNKIHKGLCNPLLISIVFVIAVLKLTDISYDTFNASAKMLSFLLTPATVALAIPLYLQIEKLRKNLLAILVGVFSGVIASMGSIAAMAALFSLSHEEYVTLLPKSITTAIGMGVSEELGGHVTISVAVIVVTGILGNLMAQGVLRLFRITDPIAKGLALGTSSHAIGTSKAMEIGETEGAMSGLAIVIAGLMTVIGASLFAQLI